MQKHWLRLVLLISLTLPAHAQIQVFSVKSAQDSFTFSFLGLFGGFTGGPQLKNGAVVSPGSSAYGMFQVTNTLNSPVSMTADISIRDGRATVSHQRIPLTVGPKATVPTSLPPFTVSTVAGPTTYEFTGSVTYRGGTYNLTTVRWTLNVSKNAPGKLTITEPGAGGPTTIPRSTFTSVTVLPPVMGGAAMNVASMPKMIGNPESVGLGILQKLDLKVAYKRQPMEVYEPSKDGIVTVQSPNPDTTFPVKSSVSVTYTVGHYSKDQEFTIPPLVGQSEDAARAALQREGFKGPVTVKYRSDANYAGKVFGSTPESGTRMHRMHGITLTVTKR